jgi:hypothetical protein
MMGQSVLPASSTDFRREKSESGFRTRQNQYPYGSTAQVAAKRLDSSTQVETAPSCNMAVTACCSTIVAGGEYCCLRFSQLRPKGDTSAQSQGRCSLLDVTAATVVPTRVQKCAIWEQIGPGQVVS